MKEKLIKEIFKKNTIKETSVKIENKEISEIFKTKIIKNKGLKCILIQTLIKRNIEEGDKLSGRHGNKGIIAKIIENKNMPYTLDGKTLDIVLNPLGIPSRMNVGQVYESLLGISAHSTKKIYEIKNFYEKSEKETSIQLTYKTLYEASKKTKKKWLFNPNYPGKTYLTNGKTGLNYEQPINVGYSYIIKLIHQVEEKINSRLIGPYSLITEQPLKGKSKKGGQRFGEMEIWSLEGYGKAYTLQEILTLKSDDTINRGDTLINLMEKKNLPIPQLPKATKIFIIELQTLCIDIKLNKNEKKKLLINEA